MVAKPSVDSPFAAFQFRDFRLFWIAQFISNIGTWMQITAINWLLYELTHSPFQLGLNGIFRAVPNICLGLFGGTITDRYDRRRLLLVTQVVLMLLAFMLGFLNHAGFIRVWHVYAFTLVWAIVGCLDNPARQAFFPSLIPRSALPNAIALNSLLWKGTMLLGPALAGIAVSTVGTEGAFYANGAGFVVVVWALLCIKKRPTAALSSGRFLKDLREGLFYVLSQKVILAVMVMEATSSIFGIDHAMLTIFASDILNVGASGLGFLQSARGLGAVLGSVILIGMGQLRSQGKVLFFSALLCALGFAAFGLSYSFPLSLALLFLVGAADTIWGAARSTILQLRSPERMRGRVMGVFGLSSRGLTPIGQVETGFVVPVIGAREATFLGGVVVLAVSLLTAWRTPELHRFQWVEPARPPEAENREKENPVV